MVNCFACGSPDCQQSVNNKRLEDLIELTGFATYTPVTVTSKTKPNYMRLSDSPDVLAAKAAEHRKSLVERVNDEGDGFNPYGSGPEPIGPRGK